MSKFWQATNIFRISFEKFFEQVEGSKNDVTIGGLDISLSASLEFCHDVDVDAILRQIENPEIDEKYDHKVIFKLY